MAKEKTLFEKMLEDLPEGVPMEELDFGGLSNEVLNDLLVLADSEIDFENI